MLKEFKEEVLMSGPESTLPCNLNKKWFDELKKCGENLGSSNADEAKNACALLMAAVVHILNARNGFKESSFMLSEMNELMDRYIVELALEDISRLGGAKIEPLTLETVLTDRDIQYELPSPLGQTSCSLSQRWVTPKNVKSLY